MSILFAAGEMGGFVPGDSTVTESSTSGVFNSAFGRCAIYCNGATAFADSAAFTATADFFAHFEVNIQGFSQTATKSRFIEFLNASDVAWVRITSDFAADGNDNISVDYWTGAAWTSAGTVNLNMSATQTFDLHVVANSASGSIKLYVAGTQRVSSGTIDLSGFAGVAKVRGWGRTVGIGQSTYLSQVIVANESTVGWRLKTIVPTSAGATTDWTGGYTEVDEVAYDDTDFVNSTTANQVELFAHSTTVPTGYTVRAVAVTARAKKGASGPQNLQLALRSSGTTYFTSSKALDAGYGAFVGIWETDPATSAAFTTSAATAIQFGVKSIA